MIVNPEHALGEAARVEVIEAKSGAPVAGRRRLLEGPESGRRQRHRPTMGEISSRS